MKSVGDMLFLEKLAGTVIQKTGGTYCFEKGYILGISCRYVFMVKVSPEAYRAGMALWLGRAMPSRVLLGRLWSPEASPADMSVWSHITLTLTLTLVQKHQLPVWGKVSEMVRVRVRKMARWV